MDKPVFSIVASAIRKNRYKMLYDCFYDEALRYFYVDDERKRRKRAKKKGRPFVPAGNSTHAPVDFELILVGNALPDVSMPDNFTYIYSDDKPSKCINIGVQSAKADYVLITSDDRVPGKLYLSWMHMFFKRTILNDMNVLLMSRYHEHGHVRDDLMRFDPTRKISAIIGKDCIFNKKVWNELGGMDERFIGQDAITDMQMRFYEIGYTPFVVPAASSDDYNLGDIGIINNDTRQADKKLLHSLWVLEDGSISKKRINFE